jgi:MFS transporter, PAT family, beta-lactamase induction signal transducer AmpG
MDDKKALPPEPVNPHVAGQTATVADDPDSGASSRNPWVFVPALYFMQGLPVVIVQQMSVVMYKRMGVPNDQIGLWTSLIAWPWIVKMLWGPLVDNHGTKRSWIIVTQALIIAGLGFVALGINQVAFLAITLSILFIVAFLSATHDIAADGFYLLALKKRQQAFFVGIRSASFRLAMIFGTGLLVMLAGRLEREGASIPSAWMTAIGIGAMVYGVLYLYNLWSLPKPEADAARNPVDFGGLTMSFAQVMLMLVGLFLFARLGVIAAAFSNEALVAAGVGRMWVTPSEFLTPMFLPTHPGHGTGVDPFPFLTANAPVPFTLQLLASILIIGTAVVSSMRLFDRIGMGPAAKTYFTQDRIVAILAFILLYRFGESMLAKMSAPFLIDPASRGGLGLTTEAVGVIIGTVGVFGLTVGGLLGAWAIAKYSLRKMLWPMVLALNVPNLFYVYLAYTKPTSSLNDRLANDAMPFAHIALGATGNTAVDGILDFVVNIPSQVYNLFLLLWEALIDPVGRLVVVEQMGYGFGFAAYMVYLMYVSQTTKRYQTSHYAISTGLMALGAMIAGIASGYVQMAFQAPEGAESPFAYARFFVVVVLTTIPGMLTLFFIPIREPAQAA